MRDEACSAAGRLDGEGYGRGDENRVASIILMSSDFLRFAAHLNEIVSHCTVTEWIDQDLNGSDLRAPGFDCNIL